MYTNEKAAADMLFDDSELKIYKMEIGLHYPSLKEKSYETHIYFYSDYYEEDAKEKALLSATKKLSYKEGTKLSILSCYEEDKSFYL